MIDLKDRLKNRADLEKLEQDLVVIERLVDEDTVGDKIKKLARRARRDLETARSAQIEWVLRLKDPQPAERQTARQEVERRIAAGETRLFDPQTKHWRPAVDLLYEAMAFEERMDRRLAETLQTEAQLADSAQMPQNLHQLHHLILRAEEMLSQEILTEKGKQALSRAREVYESGCTRHRELTLNIHNGTLKERFDALGKLRDLITMGELWILDAPDDVWRQADHVLVAAELSCVSESARLCNEVLSQVDLLAQTDLQAALRDLYLAMDLSIPYVTNDRVRLKVKYSELFAAYRQRNREEKTSQPGDVLVSADDMAGFIAVRALNQERMKKLVNQSLDWLNQFFHSSITRPLANLLNEAENEDTPPARTVELIDMSVSLARDALEGSIEIPEAMIRGAVILFNKGIINRDRELLSSAMPLYTLERADKIHRHAVTAWMLGCIEYSLGNRFESYSQWKIARSYFEELRKKAIKDKQLEKATWYRESLKEMSVYAIQTFEEVYFQWMNEFETIAMPQSLKDYRAILDRQLGADQVIPLRKTLQQFLESSKNMPAVEIKWAALVDAAFYEYEIRDYISALDHLEQAWVGFQFSHRGAVVLWLSGLIQWWLPSKLDSAVKNWETSIQIFHDLSRAADQKNKIIQHNWYDSQIEIMTASLKEWVQLTRAR
jgi:hypothetical protein